MSEEIRVNRPSVQAGGHIADMGAGSREPRGNSKLPWVILVVVVAVIVVVAVLFRDKWGGKSGEVAMKASTPSGYQAVFLTNGQVYFGKMSDARDSYIKLNDIFYLQVQNPPIQGSQEQQQKQAQEQPQLSLVKLGQELHGPVDEMHINREQVLFYEDMKVDGKVMQAIKEYKANPPATNPPASGAASQAPAGSQQQQEQQQGNSQTPPKATTPTVPKTNQ